MRRTIILFLLLTPIATFDQQKPSSATSKTTLSVQLKLSNEVDSSQYILGAYLGQYLNTNGIAVTKPDIFLKRMDDVLTNKKLLADSVSIHVKGYPSEGKIFEDTYTENKPLRTTPAALIPGLKETLQIIPVGSLWRIFVPSVLAYGDKGVSGAIPPYSAVVFDIELLTIIK